MDMARQHIGAGDGSRMMAKCEPADRQRFIDHFDVEAGRGIAGAVLCICSTFSSSVMRQTMSAARC